MGDHPTFEITPFDPPSEQVVTSPAAEGRNFGAAVSFGFAAIALTVSAFSPLITVHARLGQSAVVVRWDSFGRATTVNSALMQFAPAPGPRFGVVLLVCAAVLLLATVSVFGARPGHRIQARWFGSAAGSAALAAAACEYLTGKAYAGGFGPHSYVTFGVSLWLTLAAAIVALFPLLHWMMRTLREPE